MFRENLLSAGAAGVVAALIFTVLQIFWLSPLILHAEVYEDAAEQIHQTSATNTDAHAEHHHDAEAWEPANGLERTLFTFASHIVMGVGYALLLIGVYTLWRPPVNVAEGLLFGLAGFLVFFAVPGLGLPPELPGTKAAALASRQHWWIGTAAATAVGLALLFMQKNWILRILGVVIMVVPHIIGAPHPAIEGALAPADLQNQFRWATTITNAIFWLVLGGVSVIAVQKFSNPQHFAE